MSDKGLRKAGRLEVEWLDSYIELSSWTPIKRMVRNRRHMESRCVSVGFVLADDKRGVMLAGSVHGANATSVIVIPAGQIVKRRRLQGARHGR
jgi:hypothetical protein